MNPFLARVDSPCILPNKVQMVKRYWSVVVSNEKLIKKDVPPVYIYIFIYFFSFLSFL